MTAPSRRTFTNAAVLLGVGLFALGGTSLVPPLRDAEKLLVKALAVRVDPVDTIIDGHGSQEKPWTRRKAVPPVVPAPPRFLNIDDDPGGWFSASPLAPVDHALIFSRLYQAGHRVLGVGHLMAWEAPEPLAMDALRKQLDRFDAAVLGLPLARGAGGEPVPAPFLRMSLPASEVKGDSSTFPQVNRLAVPDAELGGERGLAGFSLLENEPDPGDGRRHLLARWDDRILFAFPLAVEIAALGLDPGDLLIHAGKDIRLGEGGPVLAIDEFGRTPVPGNPLAIDIPAMRLVSEENPVPAMAEPLLTRDVRAALPAAEKAWSDQLAGLVQALRAAPHFEEAKILPRPDALAELLLISLIALFGTWATRLRGVGWRIFAALLVTGLCAELLYLFALRQNLWLPPLAVLCPGFAALGLSFTREKEESAVVIEAVRVEIAPTPEPTLPEPKLVETTAPDPAFEASEAAPVPTSPEVTEIWEYIAPPAEEALPDEPAPARKTARKAAKKAAAKTAAKKAPAKKAAKKTTRKAAEPPDADSPQEP